MSTQIKAVICFTQRWYLTVRQNRTKHEVELHLSSLKTTLHPRFASFYSQCSVFTDEDQRDELLKLQIIKRYKVTRGTSKENIYFFAS